MLQKILDFVQFHKGVTIGLAIFLCLVGVGFAAVPNFGSYFFASEETITSIDNSAIINADLDHLNHNLKINSLREKDDGYEIGYSHDTLAVANGFWQRVGVNKILRVERGALAGTNLGAYAAKKIVEDLNSNLAQLKLAQELEKSKGLTSKVVTTTYSGVIGDLFDESVDVVESNPDATPDPSGDGDDDPGEEDLADIIEDLLNPPAPTASSTPPTTPPTTPTPTPTPPGLTPPPPAPASTSTDVTTPPTPPPFSSTPPGYYVVPAPPNYVPQPDSINSGPASQ